VRLLGKRKTTERTFDVDPRARFECEIRAGTSVVVQPDQEFENRLMVGILGR
jgi:hypothetical protein